LDDDGQSLIVVVVVVVVAAVFVVIVVIIINNLDLEGVIRNGVVSFSEAMKLSVSSAVKEEKNC